jgi:hypothetical protein
LRHALALDSALKETGRLDRIVSRGCAELECGLRLLFRGHGSLFRYQTTDGVHTSDDAQSILVALLLVCLFRDDRCPRVQIVLVLRTRRRTRLIREVSNLADDSLAGQVYDGEDRIWVVGYEPDDNNTVNGVTTNPKTQPRRPSPPQW